MVENEKIFTNYFYYWNYFLRYVFKLSKEVRKKIKHIEKLKSLGFENLRKILFYPLIFFLTYLIYVYPFDVLGYLIHNEKILKSSSLIFTLVCSLTIIYYFKTQNTFFLLKFFIYEGMGIGFISFFIVNIGLLVNNLNYTSSVIIGIECLMVIIILTIISLINGRFLKIKKIKILSSKLKREIKLIFLSDIHLGTNTKKHLERIYSKIKDLDYDFVLIGGDLIDSSGFKLNELKILKNINKPIFFISGNHEYYIKDFREKLKELKKYNLIFLDNKSYKVENINIIGVSDNQKLNNQTKIANKLINSSLFNLIVVHKPTLWNSVQRKTDLMLSGHTHNGQIFPFNFLVRLQFKNIYGLFEKLNSRLYVSSGAGCWGPKMRLGSYNEIVHFSISKDS